MLICGSTSIIEHVSPGVVVKQVIRLADQFVAAMNCKLFFCRTANP